MSKNSLKDTVVSLGKEAVDDIRHKVVEQAWSGQEQTGYLQNIYGTDVTNQATEQTTSDAASVYGNTQEATQARADDSYVRFEPTPEEQAGWWQGEGELKAASSDNTQELTPRNGWALGQDAAETRQALEAEQDAPEQDM